MKDTKDAFISRLSDSPFIRQVWQAQFTGDGQLSVTADGTWDIVFSEHNDKVTCLITGPTTKVNTYNYYKNQWALGIQFKEGTYLLGMPAREVINANRSVAAEQGTISLKGHVFTVPTYENAEQFVQQLCNFKLLARDVVIEQTLQKKDTTTPVRSIQRHFIATTGIPLSRHQQIMRAQKAAQLLRIGMAITAVVHECGYYDQAHLNRSIKQFLGTTPQRLRSEKDS